MCLPTPNPNWTNFNSILKTDIKNLIKETNIHSCTSTCFKYSKKNDKDPECRSFFPRKIVENTSIDPLNGNIEMKRKDPYINNFNPIIATAARCK